MIKVGVDLSGMAGSIGAVEGVIAVLEDKRMQGTFLEKVMDSSREVFNTETLAASRSGSERVKHVYEWGGSSTPLFELNILDGTGQNSRRLNYEFKESKTQVPFPDTSKMKGVKGNFQPHVFRKKALVMETKSSVLIKPVQAKRLFVPAPDTKRGFVMVPRARVNPGGKSATGGFADWWNRWTESRLQDIANEEAALAQRDISRVAQRAFEAVTRGAGKSKSKADALVGFSAEAISSAKGRVVQSLKTGLRKAWSIAKQKVTGG